MKQRGMSLLSILIGLFIFEIFCVSSLSILVNSNNHIRKTQETIKNQMMIESSMEKEINSVSMTKECLDVENIIIYRDEDIIIEKSQTEQEKGLCLISLKVSKITNPDVSKVVERLVTIND